LGSTALLNSAMSAISGAHLYLVLTTTVIGSGALTLLMAASM